MATISARNWGQEIKQFNPDKYGGLKDLGLYIDYHSNNKDLSAWNNNGIFKVGDTYYFVTSGDGKTKLTKDLVNALFKNYNNKDNTMYANDRGFYSQVPHGTILKITNPDLIQFIELNADENRKGRTKLGTVDKGYNNIHIDGDLPTTQKQEVQQETNPNNGGGGGYASYSAPPDNSYLTNRIKDLEAELAEYKRPKSGPELAEHYGIKDTSANRGYWAGIYTDDFNQYYDDLINKQDEYRSRYARNNAAYDDYLEREYINSYNNASNARTTRGAVAANALSTGNVNDYNSSKNDTSMMQNINALNAQRIADLAGVDYKAEQTYTNVMAKLMELGANNDASVVQDIVNSLGAASKINAEQKKYAANLATAANTAFNGLVNAKATANASTDELNALYNYYLGQTGGNKIQASNMMTNYWGRTGAGY
jgi:hypothetical protein